MKRRAVIGSMMCAPAMLVLAPSRSARAQWRNIGRLDVTVTSAGGPFPGTPRFELRQGDTVVLTATGTQAGRPHAVFNAPTGHYSVRVLLPGERQFVDIPNLMIVAGRAFPVTVEVGAAQLSVGWTDPDPPCTSARPCAIVHVERDGQLVLSGISNPSNFVLLSGRYDVDLNYASRPVGRRSLTLAAGDRQTMAFAP